MEKLTLPQGLDTAGLGKTRRRDSWWFEPLWTGVGFALFVVYSTWAAFNPGPVEHPYYEWGPYLSPFFSPLFLVKAWPEWWPKFLRTPSLFILWIPLGFRLTCYYFRRSYYRSYFLDPPACAVGEARSQGYKGEKGVFIFQNLHRYFLYPALALVVILTYDGIKAFFFEDGFGIGIGTIVLVIEPILIALFTFSCNSFRHLVGGNLDCFSCSFSNRARFQVWKKVSFINRNHKLWFWVSLLWVGFSDFYVRMVAMGIWSDWRIL